MRPHELSISIPTIDPLRTAAVNAAWSAGPARYARAPLAARKRGKQGSTMPRAARSAARSGTCGVSLDLTSSSSFAERAGEPCPQAVRGHVPTCGHVLRFKRHAGRRPHRHRARAQGGPDGRGRFRHSQRRPQAGERAPELLHREEGHAMRGAVVEAHRRLRGAHRICKRPAAGNNDDAAGRERQRIEPCGKIF